MKQLITLIAASFLLTGNAVAAGVWAPQTSSGAGGGGGGECLLVHFNAGDFGDRRLMGNGYVDASGFTGFLRSNPTPQNSGTSYARDCNKEPVAGKSVGHCAWQFAGTAATGSNYNSVVVSALPIISAQAVACF